MVNMECAVSLLTQILTVSTQLEISNKAAKCLKAHHKGALQHFWLSSKRMSWCYSSTCSHVSRSQALPVKGAHNMQCVCDIHASGSTK